VKGDSFLDGRGIFGGLGAGGKEEMKRRGWQIQPPMSEGQNRDGEGRNGYKRRERMGYSNTKE